MSTDRPGSRPRARRNFVPDGSSDEDESSNEDEPVLVSAATSLAVHVLPLDCSNFLVTLTIVDEFCCASRQAVMATTVALRTLTLETQMRGKLHAHTWMAVPLGIFYVATSRVQNIACVGASTYVANNAWPWPTRDGKGVPGWIGSTSQRHAARGGLFSPRSPQANNQRTAVFSQRAQHLQTV